ncbi:MAG: hypothetical protein ABIP49_03305 [Lysobacterales bacterium]
MRAMFALFLLLVAAAAANAQSPEPPLSEARLSVHTLLREDMFAGVMDQSARASFVEPLP